jgi:hypothetical protein
MYPVNTSINITVSYILIIIFSYKNVDIILLNCMVGVYKRTLIKSDVFVNVDPILIYFRSPTLKYTFSKDFLLCMKNVYVLIWR